jgi:hypothetical protein
MSRQILAQVCHKCAISTTLELILPKLAWHFLRKASHILAIEMGRITYATLYQHKGMRGGLCLCGDFKARTIFACNFKRNRPNRPVSPMMLQTSRTFRKPLSPKHATGLRPLVYLLWPPTFARQRTL